MIVVTPVDYGKKGYLQLYIDFSTSTASCVLIKLFRISRTAASSGNSVPCIAIIAANGPVSVLELAYAVTAFTAYAVTTAENIGMFEPPNLIGREKSSLSVALILELISVGINLSLLRLSSGLKAAKAA